MQRTLRTENNIQMLAVLRFGPKANGAEARECVTGSLCSKNLHDGPRCWDLQAIQFSSDKRTSVFFVFARAPRTENKFGGAGSKNRRFYRPEWIRAGRTAQVNGEPGLYRVVKT